MIGEIPFRKQMGWMPTPPLPATYPSKLEREKKDEIWQFFWRLNIFIFFFCLVPEGPRMFLEGYDD